jgi:hypothetical protein
MAGQCSFSVRFSVVSQHLIFLGKRCDFFCRRSSTVEHLFCKQAVAGSNPIAGSMLRSSSYPWQVSCRAATDALRSLAKRGRRNFPAFAEDNFPLPDGVMVAQTTLTRFV